MSLEPAEVTLLIQRAGRGNRGAMDRVLELLYNDLRQLADRHFAHESANHTLQPTALIHESFLRLIGQNRSDWSCREHFLAMASTTMRRILTDHARSKLQQKRGGRRKRVPLDSGHRLTVAKPEDVLAVHEALEKLHHLDARQARIVELRFFGGLTQPEVAAAMGLSLRTVEGEWAMIRAWLRQELGSDVSAEAC